MADPTVTHSTAMNHCLLITTLTKRNGVRSGKFCSIQTILCITRTVKHNYILPISTVRIQLHVSVLYVDRLEVEIFNLQISYTRCVGAFVWAGAGD